MWIHEHKNWPDFTWDAKELAGKLADVRHRQGRLLGRMEGLGFDLRREASLNTLTSDVVKSSAIEGETLNPDEVRSSIAWRLGLEIAGLVPASRHVEGIVEMMLDATQEFSKPLTKDRLFGWHAASSLLVAAGCTRLLLVTGGLLKQARCRLYRDMQVERRLISKNELPNASKMK